MSLPQSNLLQLIGCDKQITLAIVSCEQALSSISSLSYAIFLQNVVLILGLSLLNPNYCPQDPASLHSLGPQKADNEKKCNGSTPPATKVNLAPLSSLFDIGDFGKTIHPTPSLVLPLFKVQKGKLSDNRAFSTLLT